MRGAINDIRQLLAGEAVAFSPTSTRLRNRSATQPMYLLAAGPRMIELAGEVADGAFLLVGLHSASIPAARRHLEAGATRAGRFLAGFLVVFVVTLGLDPTTRWERDGCEASSSPDSRFSPTPASQISAGWEKLDSNLMQRMIPPLFPRIVRIRSRTLLVCLVLQNVALTDCCGRVRRPVSRMFFCFPLITSRAANDMPEVEVEAFERIICRRLGG